MSLQNTPEKFGSLTKLLHWTIFILFMVQYFLVYRREYFPKTSPEKLQYMLLHKSFGVCVLALALTMLIWGRIGKRPAMPINMSGLEKFAAKSIHLLLYVVMFVMPITGMLMSQFAGYPVSVFGWFDMPSFFSKNESLAHFFKETHEISSFIIMGIVGIHVFAAFFHHYVRKDNVLTRMLPFR